MFNPTCMFILHKIVHIQCICTKFVFLNELTYFAQVSIGYTYCWLGIKINCDKFYMITEQN